jgi:parallel beta-helix repeat protein
MISKTTLGHAALLLLGIGALSPAAHAGTISACPTTVNAAGTWTVTKNLTATGTCITITAAANGAAIDLNGHTITGPGSGTKDTIGITDSHSCTPSCQQNIIIANGTIKGFYGGVYLTSTKYATISNMNVMENGTTGLFFLQDHATVTGSQVNNNAYGMTFEAGNNTVTNSQANGNTAWGMSFHSTNNAVNNSLANNNGGNGMEFAIGNGSNTVSNSQANNNGDEGMYFGGGGNTITGSQANGNKGKPRGAFPRNGGIYINGSGNFLAGNTANGNLDAGITLDCPSNLYGNTATGNGGSNIVLTPTGTGCARLDNNPAP